jgi:hypothetical protein
MECVRNGGMGTSYCMPENPQKRNQKRNWEEEKKRKIQERERDGKFGFQF